MDQPGILRSRLHEQSPELARELERCWEIALSGWLHAVDVKLGSSNSYPHLRNIETHLDHIVLAYEGHPSNPGLRSFTPLELYILLCAVLMHDVGKTRPAQCDPDAPGHGISSLLGRYFSDVGIRSFEIARCLARICEVHDPGEANDRRILLKNLSDTCIDPYGLIREPFIACLLTLADHMDSSFIRTLPQFVEGDQNIEVIGRFRRHVQGGYIDPTTEVVRTVLVENHPPREGSNASQRSRGSAFFRARLRKRWPRITKLNIDKTPLDLGWGEGFFAPRGQRDYRAELNVKLGRLAKEIAFRAVRETRVRTWDAPRHPPSNLLRSGTEWDWVSCFLSWGLIELHRIDEISDDNERAMEGMSISENDVVAMVLSDHRC